MSRFRSRIILFMFLLWPMITLAKSDRIQVCATISPVGVSGPGTTIASRYAVFFGQNGHWISIASSFLHGTYNTWAFLGPSEPRVQDFRDIEVLYGRRVLHGEGGYVWVGTGIARALYKLNGEEHVYTGSPPPNYHAQYVWQSMPEESRTMWGLPISIQAFLKPLPMFGLGLELYANFNDQASFGGLSFGFHVGP
jgi:hypothetical protein